MAIWEREGGEGPPLPLAAPSLRAREACARPTDRLAAGSPSPSLGSVAAMARARAVLSKRPLRSGGCASSERDRG